MMFVLYDAMSSRANSWYITDRMCSGNLQLGRFGSGGISMGGACVIGGWGRAGGDRLRSILSGDERLSGLSRPSSDIPGPFLSNPGGISRILCVSMCCFMLPWKFEKFSNLVIFWGKTSKSVGLVALVLIYVER